MTGQSEEEKSAVEQSATLTDAAGAAADAAPAQAVPVAPQVPRKNELKGTKKLDYAELKKRCRNTWMYALRLLGNARALYDVCVVYYAFLPLAQEHTLVFPCMKIDPVAVQNIFA